MSPMALYTVKKNIQADELVRVYVGSGKYFQGRFADYIDEFTTHLMDKNGNSYFVDDQSIEAIHVFTPQP
jgi:hypothetical protein